MHAALTTERLLLREFTAADAGFLLQLLNSPGWLQYIGNRNVRTEAEARAYIAARLVPSYRSSGFGFYLVERKADQTPLGMCGLVKRAELEHVDIGFALLPAFAGQGYALESARAVMDFAREQLGLPRVVAITAPENERSQRLLTLLGLQYEQTILFGPEREELLLYAWQQKEPA